MGLRTQRVRGKQADARLPKGVLWAVAVRRSCLSSSSESLQLRSAPFSPASTIINPSTALSSTDGLRTCLPSLILAQLSGLVSLQAHDLPGTTVKGAERPGPHANEGLKPFAFVWK